MVVDKFVYNQDNHRNDRDADHVDYDDSQVPY